MRRKDREMSQEDTLKALKKGTWGVLSITEGGAPYGVPVNYYYSSEENAVFFHCAKEGRKLDGISVDSRVSFTVVLSEEIIPDKFTTHYECVIAAGRASVLSDPGETAKRLKKLCEVLAPSGKEKIDDAVSKWLQSTAVVRIDIESITGKRNM
jgi:uncharacterized protein